MSHRVAFIVWLSVCALVAPSVLAQPAMLKFVFKGTCYQKDASGNIVGVPITDQDLLKARAQAGGVDPSTLAIVYHLGGDPKGDTVDVVSAADGSVQVTEFGFWFGSDPTLGRSALENDSGTEIRRVDQLFTLDNSTYTSGNSHGMGTAFITKHFTQDSAGHTNANIGGPMQWIVNLASGTKICYGTFTASSPFVAAGSAGSTTTTPPPGGGTAGSGPGPNSVTGTFSGLFYPAGGVTVSNSGAFNMTISGKSKFTGTLLMAGTRNPFRGTLDGNGSGSETITRRGAAPLSLTFQVDSAVPDQVSGSVTDGTFAADLLGKRATFDGRANVPAQVGSYTVVIPAGDPAAGQPGGDSYGTMTVARTGRVAVVATLADGTKASQSGLLFADGQSPLFLPLYGGRGVLLGWLSFSSTDPNFNLTGDVTWTKPASTSRLYPAGFTLQSSAIGSSYVRPSSGKTALSGSSAQVSLSGGDLTAVLVDPIQITKNRVTNLGSHKMSLTLAPGNGTFRGSMADSSTGKALAFSGVVLQKQNVGRGFFLGQDTSGEVMIEPAN